MSVKRFVPYEELGDTPNVIVDGGPTASTRLTLSHWPGSPTPAHLLDDVSAQIAFRGLAELHRLDGIEAVSNNHFDQDGLASAFALLYPDEAMERRDRVIDVAKAGDFGIFADRSAIRLAFALAAMSDPERSPLDRSVFTGPYEYQCARLYETLLPRLGELIDQSDRLHPLWEAEDAHLQESLDAIASGVVALNEEPTIDLVTVTVPEQWAHRVTTRFAINRSEAVHPAAINQSTGLLRVAVLHGQRFSVELRYESWVMFRSRSVAPRPDLRILAERLNDLEPGSATWSATSPGSLTPTLSSDADSGLMPAQFLDHLRSFLAIAPPAWDPYAPR